MKLVWCYANQKFQTAGEITPENVGKNLLAVAPYVVMGASGDISSKVASASWPIKELLLGLADPVCYIVFAWGLLECMLGKSGSGINRMKYATLGYLGMNWIPVFMGVLRGARP